MVDIKLIKLITTKIKDKIGAKIIKMYDKD